MKCLKKIFLGIAIGAAPLVLAGCYGMQHREGMLPSHGSPAGELEPVDLVEVTDDSAPTPGLQTIPSKDR
jgi:hypothetical protein